MHRRAGRGSTAWEVADGSAGSPLDAIVHHEGELRARLGRAWTVAEYLLAEVVKGQPTTCAECRCAPKHCLLLVGREVVRRVRTLRSRDLTLTSMEARPGSGRRLVPGLYSTELTPFIESNYRAEPTDRAIFGYSDGGLFVLYALFSQPGTFRRYITQRTRASPGTADPS